MMFIFLGPDDFSKKQELRALAKNAKADLVIFSSDNIAPNLEELLQADLFSGPKIFCLENLLGKFNQEKNILKLKATKNLIYFLEEKIDKRLSSNKMLLEDKDIKVKQFNLPHGLELNYWLEQRFKLYGGKINKFALNLLAIFLGRDEAKVIKFGGKIVSTEEIYNLYQADAEVKKLTDFSGGNEIGEEDVKNLVNFSGQSDVFDLVNAIAEKNRQKALDLLHKFLSIQTASDEKSAGLQLCAILAEQFRNFGFIKQAILENISDSEILKITGWKEGRLFVIKKLAAKFSLKQILDLQKKLTALDQELKTSQTPVKVLWDLILVQFL